MAKSNTIGVNAPTKLKGEIEKRAGKMGISVSKYCVLVLEAHMQSGKRLVLTEK